MASQQPRRPLAHLIPFSRMPSIPRLHCGLHHSLWRHQVAGPHDGWNSCPLLSLVLFAEEPSVREMLNPSE